MVGKSTKCCWNKQNLISEHKTQHIFRMVNLPRLMDTRWKLLVRGRKSHEGSNGATVNRRDLLAHSQVFDSWAANVAWHHDENREGFWAKHKVFGGHLHCMAGFGACENCISLSNWETLWVESRGVAKCQCIYLCVWARWPTNISNHANVWKRGVKPLTRIRQICLRPYGFHKTAGTNQWDNNVFVIDIAHNHQRDEKPHRESDAWNSAAQTFRDKSHKQVAKQRPATTTWCHAWLCLVVPSCVDKHAGQSAVSHISSMKTKMLTWDHFLVVPGFWRNVFTAMHLLNKGIKIKPDDVKCICSQSTNMPNAWEAYRHVWWTTFRRQNRCHPPGVGTGLSTMISVVRVNKMWCMLGTSSCVVFVRTLRTKTLINPQSLGRNAFRKLQAHHTHCKQDTSKSKWNVMSHLSISTDK